MNDKFVADNEDEEIVTTILKGGPQEVKRYPMWYYQMRKTCSEINEDTFRDWFMYSFTESTLDKSIYDYTDCSVDQKLDSESKDWFDEIDKLVTPVLSQTCQVFIRNLAVNIGSETFTANLRIDDLILNVAITSKFSAKEVYYSLLIASKLQSESVNIKRIGWLLPLQRQVYIVDISEFDLDGLLEHYLSYTSENESGIDQIGYSYSSNNLLEVLRSHASNVPCQVLIQDVGSLTPKMIQDCRQLKCTFPLVIHGPYTVNLSNPNPSSRDWILGNVRKELEALRLIGGQGVVVHVGKAVKKSKSEAIAEMERSIRDILISATPECPLLLETPAGQGTETLTTLEEFVDFTNRFPDSNFGVCIDSCHVFATGYDPLTYTQEFMKRCPGKLRFFHFNDSCQPLGSRKDRHAPMGSGHIGSQTLTTLAQFLFQNKIPTVREY